MEGVATNRRRGASSTSCGSFATQLSYVSEDSGSPSASPTESQGSRPLFRLESQEEEIQLVYAFELSNGAVANRNRLATAASTNHSVSPTGAVTTRNASSTGTSVNGTRIIAGVSKQQQTESNKELDFEARRARVNASPLCAHRFRSESIVANRSQGPLVPPYRSHTTTCMTQESSRLDEVDETFQKRTFCGNCAAGVSARSCLRNLGVNDCSRCNDSRDVNLNTSRMCLDGQGLVYHRTNCPPPRAKSVDGLDDRGHFYESLDSPSNINKRDTEIYIVDNEAGVRLSRKRLNCMPRDDSLERNQNEARLNIDAESGYVRAAASEHKGYFSTVSGAFRRHGVSLLIVCNFLLLVMSFISIVNKTNAADPDAGNYFNCWDMSFDTKNECLETGLLFIKDKNQCCFKLTNDMNSWIKKYAGVKLSEYKSERPNITLPFSPRWKKTIASLTQKKRSILYLKSSGIRQTRHGRCIEWSNESVTSPLLQGNLGLMDGDSTHIKIAEMGVYTIRAEVKFASSVRIINETEPTLLEYHVRARSDTGNMTPIESFRQQFRFNKERSESVGIVHTVAQLKKDDTVLVHLPLPKPGGQAIVLETVGAHRITVIEET